MKMGAQIRTGKRLPDTGKRFRDRIWAYETFIQLLALSEFPISIGKSFSGADLYPHFHVQIIVEPPRLIFFLSFMSPTIISHALKEELLQLLPLICHEEEEEPQAFVSKSLIA